MDTIIRKYNYILETGVVGTDDDNIANILYNINRLEMMKSFASSDMKELGTAMGNFIFLIGDARSSLFDFVHIYGDVVQAEAVRVVEDTFKEAMQIARSSTTLNHPAKISAVFPKVYQMLLNVVPAVLELDAQAVERVKTLISKEKF